MSARRRRAAHLAAELGWWAGSGLTVAAVYASDLPRPPFPGYSLWLEGVSVWLQLAVGPALLLALHRCLAPRLRRRRRECRNR